MSNRIFSVTILTFVLAAAVIAQDTSATPAPTAAQVQMDQLQQQIDLLKKQQDFEKLKTEMANQRLKDIMAALPTSTSKAPDNKTTYADDATPSAETSSLSYEALREVSARIGEAIRPDTNRYAAIVIYNEPDFLALARYRVYRGQSEIALKNYYDLLKRLEELQKKPQPPPRNPDDVTIKTIDPVTAAMNIPAIGTSFVRSVADLLSMFRSETIITESRDTVNNQSIGTTVAYELKKQRPDLKIFYPQAFVPEYDLESEGKDSVIYRISEVNGAYYDVSDFLIRCHELPAAQQNAAPLREVIAFAAILQAQLKGLAVADSTSGGATRENAARGGDQDENPPAMSELRQLVRAEKLDRFLRQGNASLGSAVGPQAGILRLRLLASGGSRRETRNLFLGNKIAYSGSVTVEVQLFDTDGMLRTSDVYSLHTGFRKLKTENK